MYPRAILHFDGDAFFASVEQAKDWRLKGKPVVTGAERGAATSLSYEAKARGLHRGIPMRDIRRLCPEVCIVPSDYTAYSIYARRMYAIVRRYAPIVEEYSIDECFADITGLDVLLGKTHEAIARQIKADLETKLGITFGVGLAPTKTLAKAASKRHKPAGFTAVPKEKVEEFLSDVDVMDVWGLGGATGARLKGLGISTAREFVACSADWLKEHGFVKPQRDTWNELRGQAVYSVSSDVRAIPHSLMRTRIFEPSMDRSYITAELSKNVESVCTKLRRQGLEARALSFYLKTQAFTYHGIQLDFPVPTALPGDVLDAIRPRLSEVLASGVLYRASGVTLRSLVPAAWVTPDLFGEHQGKERILDAFRAFDAVNRRYGRGTVFLGSSMWAMGDAGRKGKMRMTKEKKRKQVDVPHVGVVR